MAGTLVNVVFIGSCTNGRLSDLREAARVAQRGKVAAGVRALVVPGSQAVARAAEAEGLDEAFRQAGFQWRLPGCSMCLGMNPDVLVGDEVCASTSNRNFIGRQGSPRGRTLLSIQSGGVETFRIETSGNRIRARTLVGAEFQDLDGGTFLTQETWYHMAFTFGPSGQSIYQDGVLLATSEQPLSIPMDARLRLGSAFGEARAFTGTIESARLWSW